MISTLEQMLVQNGTGPGAGGVSVLCWLAAPVAMFYGNLPKFGNKVKVNWLFNVTINDISVICDGT